MDNLRKVIREEIEKLEEQVDPLPRGAQWQLFRSMKGWRKVASELTSIAKEGARLLKAQKRSKTELIDAVKNVRDALRPRMEAKDIGRFGGHDTEPSHVMAGYLTGIASELWGFQRYTDIARDVYDYFYSM